MSKSMMTIPDKVNVGYQKRKDTYTGKLAYVVYTDEKGKLRKEKSWSSWCSKDIPKDEFNNEPTEGFVLNKKVGDHNCGWNGRKAWCRMYDPRGFEFEISVENLLFILEECTSVKGKGIEGELIYAWDGADLVLLPVSSSEYKSCREFTNMKTKKVTKNDMKEGYTYLTKDMEEVVYIGRHMWYELDLYSNNEKTKRGIIATGKKHIFAHNNITRTNKYGREYEVDKFFTQKGFTKLAKVLSDKPHPCFPELYDEFKQSANGSPTECIEVKDIELPTMKDSCSSFGGVHYNYFIHENKEVYPVIIEKRVNSDNNEEVFYKFFKCPESVQFVENNCIIPNYNIREFVGFGFRSCGVNDVDKIMSLEEIKSHQFCKIFIVNEAGAKFEVFPRNWY